MKCSRCSKDVGNVFGYMGHLFGHLRESKNWQQMTSMERNHYIFANCFLIILSLLVLTLLVFGSIVLYSSFDRPFSPPEPLVLRIDGLNREIIISEGVSHVNEDFRIKIENI